MKVEDRGAKVQGRAEVSRAEVSRNEILDTDEVTALVGNARATVTAGFGTGDSKKYARHKYDAFCSVSLSCNGDHRTIRKAQLLTRKLALSNLEEMIDEAEKLTHRYPAVEE